MAYDTLKAEIRQYIQTNGANEITGQILQNVLLDMVNAYPSLDGYATQLWVSNQLNDMATMTWVIQQGYITSAALSDMATQTWVDQNFLSLADGGIIGGRNDYRLHIEERGLYWSYSGTTGGSIVLTNTIDGLEFDISSGATLGGEAIATQTWVGQQGYITSAALNGYATQTWVGQNFLSLADGGIIGDSTNDYRLHIDERGLYWSYSGTTGGSIILTSTIDGLEFDISSGATLGGEAIATQTWVGQQGYITSAALNGYATQTWVGQQGYITSSAISDMATQTWVGQNFLSLADGGIIGDSTNDYRLHIDERGLYWSYSGNTGGSIILTSTIDGLEFDISSGATLGGEAIATQTWVSQQGYITSAALNGYATQTWVSQQGYITSAALNGYATQTWVGQNFLSLADGGIIGDNTNDYRLHIDERGLYWSYSGTTGGSIILTNTIDGLEFDISSGATLGGEAIATQTWVGQQGYITSSAISDMATQTWVGNNYLPLTGGTLTGDLTMNNSAQIVQTNQSYQPYLLFHKPNVNWTRLAMADDGTIEVRAGDTGTAFHRFACGRITVDGGSNGYGYIIVDGDGINIAGNHTDVNQVYLLANNIYCSGNTEIDGDCKAYSFIQNSDVNRKNIVSDLTLSVEDIANAPLFKFTWKDEKDGNVHIGTSAQYWQGLMPELTSENKNGVLGMQYDVAAMAGVTTVAKVVVDHEARIAELEKENALLKAKLNIN